MLSAVPHAAYRHQLLFEQMFRGWDNVESYFDQRHDHYHVVLTVGALRLRAVNNPSELVDRLSQRTVKGNAGFGRVRFRGRI